MKIYAPFLMLMALLTMIPAPMQGQPASDVLYEEAEALRKQEKYREAIARYDAAIAEDRKNYRYYFQKGRCQFQIDDYAGAKTSLHAAIEEGKEFTPASAYYLLGKVYRTLEQETEALKYFQVAADREPDQRRKSQYQLLLVQSLIEQQDYEVAERYLIQAEASDGDNARVLYYHAQLAAAQKDWPLTQRYYEQALRTTELREATPEGRAEYYFGLGVALIEQGEEEKAQQAFDRAKFGRIRPLVMEYLNARNPGQFYRLAVSYYVNEEFAISEQYLQKLLKIHPTYANAFALQARMAEQTHRFPDAISLYQQAIKLETDSTDRAKTSMQLAKLYLDLDNPAAALQSVAAAVASDRRSLGSPTLLYVKARAEYLSGRHREAVATFDRLLQTKLAPRQQAAYSFMQGMAAKQAKQTEKAIAAFKGARYGPFKPAAEAELEALGVLTSTGP
jgi:tetratricopeptide (TPR) repeat protein